MADVRLTDLEIIQRYSIAVRGETADRAELVEALRADLAWLEGGGRARRAAPDADATEDADAAVPRRAARPSARQAAKAAPRRAASPASVARKPAAAKPAARRAAAPAKRAAKKATKPAARRGR